MVDARTRVSTLKEEGNGKLKSGDLEQAIALYQQAVAEAAQLPPKELASVWSNLALALLKQGSAAESVVAADKCIAAKPEWHKAHYRRGDALFHLRRYTEARGAYARAQELAADDREVAAALVLTAEAVQGGVWFRQLLPGRDFAVQASSPMEELVFGAARQMQNHIYIVGCATSRECYVVDGCWDTDGIAAFARRNKMRLVGAVGTHYHFDHCGGEVPPQMAAMVSGPFGGKPTLPGLREMKRDHGAAVHIHAREVERIAKQCDLELGEISPLEQGARLPLGEAGEIEVLHTPGHSGGSVCLCVRPSGGASGGVPLCLLSGDTIFPGSCGRLDLPDSDVDLMFESLAQLRNLPEELKVYPGHAYGGASTTIGREKQAGLLRPISKEEFLRMFSR